MGYFKKSETVSPAEVQFGLWFRKTFRGEGLMPDNDWYHPRSNTLFEVKDISYPRSHFERGVIRLNLVSMERHLAVSSRYNHVYVVLSFSDGTWLYSTIEQVASHSQRVDSRSEIGNRPSLWVDLAVFEPLEKLRL